MGRFPLRVVLTIITRLPFLARRKPFESSGKLYSQLFMSPLSWGAFVDMGVGLMGSRGWPWVTDRGAFSMVRTHGRSEIPSPGARSWWVWALTKQQARALPKPGLSPYFNLVAKLPVPPAPPPLISLFFCCVVFGCVLFFLSFFFVLFLFPVAVRPCTFYIRGSSPAGGWPFFFPGFLPSWRSRQRFCPALLALTCPWRFSMFLYSDPIRLVKSLKLLSRN